MVIKVSVDKQLQGFCLYYAEGSKKGLCVTEGEPHMKSIVYRRSLKEIIEYAEEHGMEVI